MLRATPLVLLWVLLQPPEVTGQSRIINGNVATSVPYQARVSITVSGQQSEICGAVVVSESYVLTAAHCCDTDQQWGQSVQSTFTVTAGTLSRTSGGHSRAADRVYIHPLWDDTDAAMELGYDACLLHLSSPFSLGGDIALIPIADTNPSPGTRVRVTGWGSITGSKISLSEPLLEAYLTVLSSSTVAQWFGALRGTYDCNPAVDVPYIYNFSMVIATGNNNGIVYDACQGDSGGPVAIQNSDGSFSLAGVVSHGYGCGEPGLPSFQTNVVASKRWVELVVAGVSGIRPCNGRTCGPNAECSPGGTTCVCKPGYYLANGWVSTFGYTCQRWLNGGAPVTVGGQPWLYQLLAVPTAWGSQIIRGYSPTSVLKTSVGIACGNNFWPTTAEEGQTVSGLVSTYAAGVGLSASAVWTAIATGFGGSYYYYLSQSQAFLLGNTSWAPGEPSGGNCGALLVAGASAGLLDAVPCSTALWYIVKYSLPNASYGGGQTGGAVAVQAVLWPLVASLLTVAVFLM